MTIEEIKKKVAGPDYDFLRNNEHLGSNIILLGLGGSYAYGLENPNSDVDILNDIDAKLYTEREEGNDEEMP